MSIDLIKGLALVVDDQFAKGNNGDDPIDEIVSNIRGKGIPVVGYDNLADANKVLENLLTINFVILDWQMLEPSESLVGVQIGESGLQDNEDQVLEFINKVNSICFSPIFIFTNYDKVSIIDKLATKGFYLKEGRNYIFVKNKSELLKGDHLLTEIEQWIDSNPSIYVLKQWEQSFFKAKNNVFRELYNNSKGLWPKILWINFENEGEDPIKGMNDTIFSLIIAESDLNKLKGDKIKITAIPDVRETKELFRRIMYQVKDLEGIKPGDIFKDKDKYFLNIRPECDTVEGRPGCYEVYLIEGRKLSKPDIDKLLNDSQYNEKTGLAERVNQCFIYLLDGNDIVEFDFKKLTIQKCKADFKGKRICRLLPPYITKIQQRYSAYLGRFGIPRLPLELEKEILAVTALGESVADVHADVMTRNECIQLPDNSYRQVASRLGNFIKNLFHT